jgi:ABC-type multidrug transport system fused ATPase/permease subunit
MPPTSTSPPPIWTADARWAGLLHIGKLYLLIGFGAFLMRFVQGYLLSWLGQKILFDMRADIFSKILRLPFRYFDRHPVGRLMTRVSSDVDAMQRLLTDGLIGLVSDLLMLFGTLGFMFWVNPRLALIMLVLLPPLLGILFVLNVKVRGAHRVVRKKQSALNSYLQEGITGMTTVQLFNREADARARFEARNGPLRDAFLHSVKWFSLAFPATEIMGALATTLVLGYGGYLILHGRADLTIGELLAFLATSATSSARSMTCPKNPTCCRPPWPPANASSDSWTPTKPSSTPRPRPPPPACAATSRSRRSGLPTKTRTGCCATCHSISPPAPRWPSWAPPARASRPSSA